MNTMQENDRQDVQDDDYIDIIGANENNLRNVSVRIPRNKLVVITGLTGSGKSSLVFDTLYAEAQRRYMETFSAYARQFIGAMDRPDVEKIDGLSPVISIEQKTTAWNPRSTVGTTTEIYDFLRLLYARVGEAYSFVPGKLPFVWDKSDDDNARDPFTFRYIDPRNLASEYNWSDRDQRHRFNAFATFILPYDINLSPIIQYRSAQPISVTNRGTFPNIILRNTQRLTNEFFTLDVRVSKLFKFNETMSLEPIFEAFNLTNSRNQKSLPRPLTFNFDGTVSAGFGEPRQAQLGVRFKF